MKKKMIVILLIFSLFLTISSVSAMESIDDVNADHSDFELINNENFNGDETESIEYSLGDNSDSNINSDSNFANSIEEDSLIDNEYPIGDTENIDENPLLSRSTLINTTEDDDQILYAENDYLKLGNPLMANNRGTSLYISPDGTGTGESADNPTNWNNAYSLAQNDDIIYFLDGIYEIINFNLNKNLNLIAVNVGSAVINGNGNRIFYTQRNNMTYNGLTFINGNYSSNGGALYSNQGNMEIINSTFINNTAANGGAVYVYSGNLSIVDSKFINNSANTSGGAIYSYRNLNITNSDFENNSANSLGGAIYSYNGNVEGSNFTNNSGRMGGAIYTKENLNVDNSNFDSNNASDQGGAILANTANVDNSNFTNNIAKGSGAGVRSYESSTITNCSFTNNTSLNGAGGALYSKNNIVNSSDFNNNAARTGGGAIYSNENVLVDESSFVNNSAMGDGTGNGGAVGTYKNGTIANSNFTENSASRSGGAVYSQGSINIDNSKFENNNASRSGGAVYSQDEMNVDNSVFESNSAIENGGALYNLNGFNITNSILNNNSAELGGALYGNDGYLENNDFTNNQVNGTAGAIYAESLESRNNNIINNSAYYYGGGLFVQNLDSENDLIANNSADYIGGGAYVYGSSTINNSTFDSNEAVNGGGLFNAENSTITNSTFANNQAYDGSAIISGNLNLNNSNFENNTSRGYGIVYAVNATIENNNFTDNAALEDKQIYVLNELNEQNNSLSPNQIEDVQGTPVNVQNVDEDTYLVELENGLIGYCLQRTMNFPEVVYLLNNLSIARNQLTGEDVSEYLKILIYKYYFTNANNLTYNLWEFTDSDFRNSNREITKDVISLFDSGFRVPDYNASLILENGTQVLFNFYTAADATTQNLFLFNITFMGNFSDMEIEKITLNKTVLNGEQVQFIIRVKNTGDTILHGISVIEDKYDGLIYDSFIDRENKWTYNNKRWTYNNQLNINETIEFIVVFNTTKSGNFTNVIVVSSNETDNKTTNNTTSVYTPNMTIQKISNNKIVKIGETVRFTIILTNTGDCNLTGVYIKDNEYSNGLVYLSYIDKNNEWTFDGIDTWTYKGILQPGESISLDILFRAITAGVKNNTAIAGHNITNDTVNSTNTTKVIVPNEPDSNKTTKKIPKIDRNVSLKTGNPILVLLICLMSLILIPIRNRK